jgi:hypothetical protein
VLEALVRHLSWRTVLIAVQHESSILAGQPCSTKCVQMLHSTTFHPHPSSVAIRFRSHAANQPSKLGSTVHSHLNSDDPPSHPLSTL